MRDWIDWYDSDHTIYVNARHRDVHFRRIATDILEFVPNPNATVLDYGCGEALHAELIAVRSAKLLLAEPAAGVRARLAVRYADNAKIAVRSLEDLASSPKHAIDLVVMHSVAQYMTPTELGSALERIRELMKPQGLLVLGDIIAPQTPAAVDALSLLGFGWDNGFFIAAFTGLVRTFLSDYWRLRSTIGLTRYDAKAIETLLLEHGFSGQRTARNIGHNQARATYRCNVVQVEARA
jgi:SAM-dependent methyltransferase